MSTSKLNFLNYKFYDGIDSFELNFGESCDSGFNNSTKFKPKPSIFTIEFLPSSKIEEEQLKNLAKELELELISREIQKNNEEYMLKLSKNAELKELKKIQKRIYFLNFKKNNLENFNYDQWKFEVDNISEDLTDKITPKKKSYDKKDILLIANVIAKIFKNPSVTSHQTNLKHIKNYVSLVSPSSSITSSTITLNIFSQYAEIFGSNTRILLLKSLSFFVEKKKTDYISIILQTIDIFTTNKQIGSELYKEIMRIGDPISFDIIYNKKGQEYDYSFGTEVSPSEFYNELKDELEKLELSFLNSQNKQNKQDKEDKENKEDKIFKAKKSSTIYNDIFDYLVNFYKANKKKEKINTDINKIVSNLYLWKYNTINSFTQKENTFWVILDETKVPEDAHPKYSYYIDLPSFLKFIINSNFFTKREIFDDSPQLGTQIKQYSTPSCWNGVNKSVKDAIDIIPPKPITKKVKQESNQTENISHHSNFYNDNHDYCDDCDYYYDENEIDDDSDYHRDDKFETETETETETEAEADIETLKDNVNFIGDISEEFRGRFEEGFEEIFVEDYDEEY
jgi:hypothetical protein